MKHLLAELNSSIEAIADASDKEIAVAMTILVSSIFVGANVQRLTDATGFPSGTIQAIADTMAKAGLWIGEMVEASEWWNENGELDGVALFAHAQVALGSVVRMTTPDHILYMNPETGEEVLRRKRTLH